MTPASAGPVCSGSGSTSTGRNPASPAYRSRYRATGESNTATRVRVTSGAGAAPCATSQAGSSWPAGSPAAGAAGTWGEECTSVMAASLPRAGARVDAGPRGRVDNKGVPLTIGEIRAAPKVLLHDHLDGGLRAATVVDL